MKSKLLFILISLTSLETFASKCSYVTKDEVTYYGDCYLVESKNNKEFLFKSFAEFSCLISQERVIIKNKPKYNKKEIELSLKENKVDKAILIPNCL